VKWSRGYSELLHSPCPSGGPRPLSATPALSMLQQMHCYQPESRVDIRAHSWVYSVDFDKSIWHLPFQYLTLFSALKILCILPGPPASPSRSAYPWSFTVCTARLFQRHLVGLLQHTALQMAPFISGLHLGCQSFMAGPSFFEGWLILSLSIFLSCQGERHGRDVYFPQ
jgi:hypothetical protein